MIQPYRICVLGSSHTAALIQAWKSGMPEAALGLSITFFAVAGRKLDALAWQDGALVPTSEDLRRILVEASGGKDCIVPTDYDAIVLNAFGLRFAEDVVEFARDYGTMEHVQLGAPPHLLSWDCFAQTIEQMFAQRQIFRCLRDLRSAFGGPIVVCAAPYLPRSIFQEEFGDTPRCNDPAYLQLLVHVFENAVGNLCAKYGAEPIWQDEITIEPPCFTVESFALGSATLQGKDRNEINKHMNEAFGAIRLRQIFSRLDRLSGGRVPKDKAGPVVPLRKVG